jgi:hypothetical protein
MSDLIPSEHRTALVKFTSLLKSEAESLIEALEQAAPALMVGDVARRIAKKTEISPEIVRDVLFMLASMARARVGVGLTVEEFVDALAPSLEGSNSTRGAKEWARTKSYLQRALSSSAIQVTAKALQVAGEHERFLCHARILSDMRPVFDDDTLDARAIVITHQLKIAVHESDGGDEASDLYIAVDRGDLVRLRAVIDRALEKQKKLEELAEKTGLPVLSARNHS